MTMQINLRLDEEFLDQIKAHAKSRGFLNVQEFFREAVREKLFDEAEVRPEYLEVLKSKDANTFLSEEESLDFEKEMRKKANLE